jgi:hypothetical protein
MERLNGRVGPDVGGQECLALLLAEAGALGALAPRQAWLTGAVVGGAIAVGELAILTVGGSTPASQHPAGAAGAASLLVLVVPALIAAHGVAALRRRA